MCSNVQALAVSRKTLHGNMSVSRHGQDCASWWCIFLHFHAVWMHWSNWRIPKATRMTIVCYQLIMDRHKSLSWTTCQETQVEVNGLPLPLPVAVLPLSLAHDDLWNSWPYWNKILLDWVAVLYWCHENSTYGISRVLDTIEILSINPANKVLNRTNSSTQHASSQEAAGVRAVQIKTRPSTRCTWIPNSLYP